LPAPAAYYNDQSVASAYTTPTSVALDVSKVGTWSISDSGEVFAIDIAYASYATFQQYYKEAFIAAVAQVLGVAGDAVYVNDFQQSASGTTLIYFDIELKATSSSETTPPGVTAMFAMVQGLFNSCNGAGNAPVGCNAASNSTLVQAMRQYGLPVCNAFYNQQPSPTSETCTCGDAYLTLQACIGMGGSSASAGHVLASGRIQ
jgi:hypothetical protein